MNINFPAKKIYCIINVCFSIYYRTSWQIYVLQALKTRAILVVVILSKKTLKSSALSEITNFL